MPRRNSYDSPWFFAAALFIASTALAETPSVIAVRNARIHTASGPVIENGNVIVRKGLIEAVGANAAIPPDAWVIEGAGLHVYPGLIDGLSTWGIPAPTPPPPGTVAAVAAAPPPARGPEDRPANTSWVHAQELVQPADKNIAAARDTGYTTAVVFPNAGIFAGQGAAMNLAGEKTGQMVVASSTGQYISLATRGFTSFPGSLMGAIAYVRQIYLDADHYMASQRAYRDNARGIRRPDYDRALEGVIESPRVLLPASRRVEIDRMLRFGAELKRPFVLYGGHQAYRSADLLKAAGAPILISLNWPKANKDADPEAEAEASLRTLEMRDKAPSGPAALDKAGTKFAFYSGGIEKPSDLRKAVKRAIDAGLSPAAALRALTLSVAEIYGFADRTGSIEPGKIANLVVIGGDLFQESTKIRYVLIDGVKYEPAPEPPKEEEKK
ncbi:MAG: amidohydrolase family protein [Bryobacteraceae bacterium]